MLVNLRNIFARMQPTQQDIQTLHGIVMALARRPQGTGARRRARRRGGARRCARCSPNTATARVPGERGPVRGLARLLRRNPTEAERTLWEALTNDRRFAGQGFKRQVPVGPHITDFVSFPLRVVIDLVPARESEIAAKARADRRAWLMRARLSRARCSIELVESDLPGCSIGCGRIAGVSESDTQVRHRRAYPQVGYTRLAALYMRNSDKPEFRAHPSCEKMDARVKPAHDRET